MSQNNGKIKILSIFGFISIGLLIGLLYGLGTSIYNIYNHNYIDSKLYNLSLFEIQSNITGYSFVFAIILLIAYVFFKFINKLAKLKSFDLFKYGTKQSNNLIFLVKFSLLYAIICFVFYSDIVLFLKILSLDISFGSFVSKSATKIRILIIAFMLISFSLLLLITYILSRLNLIETIKEKLVKLIHFKQTQLAGFMVLALLIGFNIFIFFYTDTKKQNGPNVILITIDTLRADRLGSYGHKRDSSPNIDSLAEKGVLFENAYSQSSWTYPSMASMHTSLYPTQVGITRFQNRINDKLITISEFLKNNFYNTYAVVSNIVVSEIFGFGQGFDQFEETYGDYGQDATSKITTSTAINFIKKNKDNKFFLWVHYMDPHSHYINHDEFDYGSTYKGRLPSKINTKFLNKIKNSLEITDLNYINDLYDEEISYTDKYIGELIESLNKLGIEENTIIILTADHGEEFMERTRFGHGHSLYQELIRVPLIVYNPLEPKQSGKRVTKNVEVRYIAKTILDITNSGDNSFDGYNLFDVETENVSYGIVWSELSKTKNTVYLDDWKLIADTEKPSFELFNLKEDPYEQTNQFNSDRPDIAEVKKILIAKLSEHNNLKTAEIKKIRLEEENIKKLKALGYLQ